MESLNLTQSKNHFATLEHRLHEFAKKCEERTIDEDFEARVNSGQMHPCLLFTKNNGLTFRLIRIHEA